MSHYVLWTISVVVVLMGQHNFVSTMVPRILQPEFPDPREHPNDCGAINSSSICDPQQVLSSRERLSLNRILTNYVSTCQCGWTCSRNESTVLLFVLPNREANGSHNKSGSVKLELAKKALQWRTQLTLDSCQEDLLIFICGKVNNNTDAEIQEIFISVGIGAQHFLTVSCISYLYEKAKHYLRLGNITGAVSAILDSARYIRHHEVPCRERYPYHRGGVSLEITLAIILSVIIFSFVSCVLLTRLCRGMDSPLLARARLMIFHPDHDKQLLSQLYDSIQFNTEDFTMTPPNILPETSDLAEQHSHPTNSKLSGPGNPGCSKFVAQSEKVDEEEAICEDQPTCSRAADQVQLHRLRKDTTYHTFESSNTVTNTAIA